jgi:hypothetical protein
LVSFWRVLHWKILVIFMGILVHFPAIWYLYFMVLYIYCGHLVHFPRLGKLYHEKSGNPALWPLKRKHPRVLCNTTAHAQLTCCGIYCTIFPP